jgi:hypothetical protein
MRRIDSSTSLVEIASLVSQALEAAGIVGVLSGGGAVSVYSENEYESVDLDFVTSTRNEVIAEAVAPLGFRYFAGSKDLAHPDSRYTIEFPPGPLAFGSTAASNQAAVIVETDFGPVRIITPTQSVMDRLAHYVFWNDNQALDQAVTVARRHTIDWDEIERWAVQEGASPAIVQRLRAKASCSD